MTVEHADISQLRHEALVPLQEGEKMGKLLFQPKLQKRISSTVTQLGSNTRKGAKVSRWGRELSSHRRRMEGTLSSLYSTEVHTPTLLMGIPASKVSSCP